LLSHGRFPAIAAVLFAAAVTLGSCGSDDAGNPDSRLTPDEAGAPLSGAPARLAALRDQANQILDGGTEAFEQRLGELRGFPVVVNKWASWCGPCRFEFPFFQSQAEKRGAKVAFLGDFANDARDAGETFLEELPLPYPSYLDQDQDIAAEIGTPRNFPATAFYDSSGRLVYTHQGQYRDEATLAADIERYAR
jgi:cytochrome c biogenesis protein CcmG, thiol:disulfide interchange protein DsbE